MGQDRLRTHVFPAHESQSIPLGVVLGGAFCPRQVPPLYLRALAEKRVAPRPAPAPANRGEDSPGWAGRDQSAPSPPPGRQLWGKFVEPRKTSRARWPSADRRVAWDGYLPRGLRNAGPAPGLAPSRPFSGLGSVAHGRGRAVHAGRQGGPA